MDDDAIYAARIELVDFLIEALWNPPTEEFVESLLSGEIRFPTEGIDDDLDAGFERLRAFIDANEGRPVEEVQTELNREYTRIFVGPRPPVTAHESYYREDMDYLGKGKAMVESSYGAAGWKPPESYPEEADYVAVELAFLRRQIERQRTGAEEAFGYERVFLDEHLDAWVDDFVEDVLEKTDNGLYRAGALVFEGLVEFEDDIVAQMVSS